MSSYTTDMADCLDACANLSTKRSWFGLGTSPQGRCQATCGKTVRYDTGYGDPDEMYDIAVQAMIEAEFQAAAGTPVTHGPGDTIINQSGGASPQSDPMVIFGALSLIGGLVWLGMKK